MKKGTKKKIPSTPLPTLSTKTGKKHPPPFQLKGKYNDNLEGRKGRRGERDREGGRETCKKGGDVTKGVNWT